MGLRLDCAKAPAGTQAGGSWLEGLASLLRGSTTPQMRSGSNITPFSD